MMAIFYDMIEKTMEVFMDDFSVFRNSFGTCLSHLDKMLKRCEDINLFLNWEKSHFMVKEGIVLGHKISKNGIEVDKAKVNVIAKLPHPTTVKVRIKSSGGVFTARKPLIFLRLATMDPLGDIMTRTTPPKRCLTLVSTGPQSIVMPMTWSNLVTLVNVREKFRNGMKCLKIPSKFMRSSTYGASISWGRSRLHEGTSIYSWPSITCRNGLKRMRFPPTTPDDRGMHFCNDLFAKVMLKYGVTHRLATAYHPQTSGQVEVYNRGLKRILERTTGENRATWSEKLDDALWAFRIAFKTPIGCTPYKLKVQLNELNELRDQAYDNSLIYKEKTKRIHDSKIKDRVFNVGDRVLLFNSRLKIFSGKLKTCWTGPFTITQVFPYGTVELSQTEGPNFKVNGYRLKYYFGGDIP
uniref:Reverse transcriptase domain-containing protein n=1 Tax=Tanacetum cinerariifolium TaxID=118510 RepID=A0A6L2J673_TANCI|nr:reverse transcriptase domain-containing protein [Tanacetum cinerariifolium]